MEQQEPRKDFVKALHTFCEGVELNEAFMAALRNHSNHEYIDEVLKFDETEDDMAKKVFIFLEFTRERSTCNEMVTILRESGQDDAADMLEDYNSSPPFMKLSDEIELPITLATVLRSGGSKYFPMGQKPRGMFIIINNMKNKLEKESLRFKNIGEQLGFVVEDFYDMNATEMEKKLTELSKEKKLTDGDALIVMTISHGHDEKIEGADGSEIRATTIVDIFHKILEKKLKLFFFNCCRKKRPKIPVIAIQETDKNRIVVILDNPGQNWINDHKKTMVCFTCAEGDFAYHIPEHFTDSGEFIPAGQFTYFGQALSHCIAQYACDKSVQSIMNLTYERMKHFENLYGDKVSTEVRYFGMDREIYLNPGKFEDEI